MCDLVSWPVLFPGVIASHELFHLCVLVGTLIHFRFLLQVVAPYEVVAVAENGESDSTCVTSWPGASHGA
jgi:hypothetical protein